MAALLPLAVLALVFGVIALTNQQSALEDSIHERVVRISALLDREIVAQVELLQMLAEAPQLDDGDLGSAAVVALLARAERGRSIWVALSLSDIQGNRLVDLPDLITGERGQVVDIESHRQVVQSRATQIGRILRGRRGRPAFAVRVPVVRGDQVRGVLSAVIDPAQVREVLFAGGLPEGWTGAVIDGDGRVVARTSGPSTLIGEPASDSARAAVRAGERGLYRGQTLEGVRSLTTFERLRNSDWSVHIAIPLETYLAPINRSFWLMIGGGAVTLALVAVFGFLLARERAVRHAEAVALDEARHLEALGRMTGGVAHDFNNLLMIVQGAATAIRRHRANPDRAAAFIDAILTACERGAAITKHLLAFARRSPHEARTFDLADRLPSLEALVHRSMREDVIVAIEVSPGTFPVRADPNALEVALINLAINARDAMPSGGRFGIMARNAMLTKGADFGTGLRGGFVAIAVEDNGTGIAPEHLPRVFEPFFTTKDTSKGTGLGLSQVFGFVRQSGGGVAIDSKLGRGTVVTLFLPWADQAPERPPVEREVSAEPPGRRVLVVEDDPAVASVTSDMLASAGFTVTVAANAEAALAVLETSAAFDVILSDIVLGPGQSGLDLARIVRKRDPSQRIVLMTGYSEALTKGNSEGLPILSKPFGRAALVAALRAALGEAAMQEGNVISLAR